MNSKKTNPVSIFEINQLNKFRQVSSDVVKEKKEIQLPKFKDNTSKDSFIDNCNRQDN